MTWEIERYWKEIDGKFVNSLTISSLICQKNIPYSMSNEKRTNIPINAFQILIKRVAFD